MTREQTLLRERCQKFKEELESNFRGCEWIPINALDGLTAALERFATAELKRRFSGFDSAEIGDPMGTAFYLNQSRYDDDDGIGYPPKSTVSESNETTSDQPQAEDAIDSLWWKNRT